MHERLQILREEVQIRRETLTYQQKRDAETEELEERRHRRKMEELRIELEIEKTRQEHTYS